VGTTDKQVDAFYVTEDYGIIKIDNNDYYVSYNDMIGGYSRPRIIEITTDAESPDI